MQKEYIICFLTIFFLIMGNAIFLIELFIYKIYVHKTFEESLIGGILLPFYFLIFSLFKLRQLKIMNEDIIENIVNLIYVNIRFFKKYFTY